MKKNIAAVFKLFILLNLLILALLSMPERASAEENSVFWKHQEPGHFATVVDKVKTGQDGPRS